jgi:hypothetical protein
MGELEFESGYAGEIEREAQVAKEEHGNLELGASLS